MIESQQHKSTGQGKENEGDKLLVRRTQGDLLQKLRQLRLWQQHQQEHLLQDKEKKLNLIYGHEKRLQHVQEYQRQALVQSEALNGGHVPRSTRSGDGHSYGHSLVHGEHRVSSQIAGTHTLGGTIQAHDVNQNISPSTTITGNFRPNQTLSGSPKTLLLSPKHFQSPMGSPVPRQTQNPMLLTQRMIHLPMGSDDELSQFTDDGSIGEIEGVQPIEDTTSEMSEDRAQSIDDDDDDDDDDDHIDVEGDDYGNDDYDDYIDDQNETLTNEKLDSDVEGEREEEEEEKEDDGEEEEEERTKVVNIDEDDHNTNPSFDELPIKSTLIGVKPKTFEELLDEKLQTEHGDVEGGIKSANEKTKPPVKRTFLRKGEGIARFGMKQKKILKKKENPKHYDLKLKNTEEQRNVLTRKIATNKQTSIPSQMIHTDFESPQNALTNGLKNELSSHVIGPYTSIDVAMATEVPTHGSNPGVVEFRRKNITGVSGSEDSFMERMKKYDELEIVEKNELNEFELLEEAAANCSLSSNSSTVLRILGSKNDATFPRNNYHGGENAGRVARKNPGRREAHTRIVEEHLDGSEEFPKNDNTDDDDDDLDDKNDTLTKSDEESNDGENTLKNDRVIIHSSLSDGFNDSEAWDEDDDHMNIHRDPMISLNTSTPDAKARPRDPGVQLNSPHSSSTPPTSHLVAKMFPQLKPKANAHPKIDKVEAAFSKKLQSPKSVLAKNTSCGDENNVTRAQDGGESFMSNAVKDKLQELEKEIEKFREENAMLHQLREAREKELQEIQRERSLFESQKAEELEKLEKFKAEEERRLRRDKRVFEQYQKASRALPDKKEREEISALKTKMNEIQEDMKLRESRWSAAAKRYKDRIRNLEKENKEMKEEVKLLEKQNLELQRKDQQKARELQQYKILERKKLTEKEEQQRKKEISSQTTTTQVLDLNESKEKELNQKEKKYRTPPNSPTICPEEPMSPNITSLPSRVDHHNTPPTRENPPTTKEPASIVPEILQNRTMTPGGENKKKHEANQSSYSGSSIKQPSPLDKQHRTSKSVRFEDENGEPNGATDVLPKEICHSDGKREVINADGSRVVTFSNGTRKEISSDGLSTIVTFFNGDVKQIMPDDRVVYYYADAQTTHTTYPDGMQVLHFPSTQIEKHYPDGTKEIIFPDQTVKYLYQSGSEECVFADGTVERITGNGDRIIEFPNGQRETYTKLYKKREYPDGTVKTVYTDGRQETRYPSGRLRVKDSEGRLLVDTAEEQAPGSM